jgi:hypothetical protein
MTLKDLIYSNEENINDKLNHCKQEDCKCKKFVKYEIYQNNKILCLNTIKRGPFTITKDLSYKPPVVIIKKNNKLHSTIGPAISQEFKKTLYFLYGISVSKIIHSKYNRDIFKNDFFNKIRLLTIITFYHFGIYIWKKNILYAILYNIFLLFWLLGIYNIVLIVNFNRVLMIATCLFFTWQFFKIIKNTRKEFEENFNNAR